MIVGALRRAYASVLTRSGGVYFVPQKYVSELEAISHVVESLPMAEMVYTGSPTYHDRECIELPSRL